jgi:hypothetical protein
MENYVIKVIIESVNGTVIAEETFDTNTMIEMKAFGDANILENFVNDKLTEISADRRDNPHHHQNRLD